jgi:hypothetical protein
MANMSLPPEERDLTPSQVAALDMRRRKGTLLLMISGMFGVIAVLLTLWAGQDWQYSPGIAHPMIYYFLIASGIVVVAGGVGVYLRRGTPEIQ